MANKEMVQQAIQLFQAGKRVEARKSLQAVLIEDRDDPYAWAVMVPLAESKKEAIFCLKQVLRLKPGDAWATDHLRRLERSSLEPLPGSQRASLMASIPPPEPLSPDTLSKNVVVRSLRSRVQSGEPMMPVAGVQVSPATQVASLPGAGVAPPELQPQARPAPSGEQTAAAAKAPPTMMSSLIALSPIILVGVFLLVVALVVWSEFFATRPGDAERAVQAAQEWTVAYYELNYGAMERLVCRRYLSDIRQAKQAQGLFDIFTGALGVDLSGEPPNDLVYTVADVKGNRAQVHVAGFFGGLAGLPDEMVYTMKREGGDWKWCGQEYDRGEE